MFKLNLFGPGAQFNHIGLAVRSITEAMQTDDMDIVSDEQQGVSAAFVNMDGIPVELIEPLGEHSPIDANLQKKQPLVHLSFTVPDLALALDEARKHKFHRISEPKPAKAFEDKHIVWVFSQTYGLVELIGPYAV